VSLPDGVRLVLLRHGRTAHNHAGIWQGHADVALDDVGRLQVKAAAECLLAERPVAVVASDLSRARDTGQAVADAAGVPLTLDPRLREIDVGVWEDRTDADIAADGDAEALAAYRRGEDVPAGRAERLSDVGRRGAEALAEHAASVGVGTIVVAAHGVVLRCGALTLLGIPRERWSMLGGLPNCGWGVLAPGRHGWRMLSWAVTAPDGPIADAPGSTGVNPAPPVV
jgi:glucosyl-3-phosphoglycerate phosphatase